MLKEFSLNKEKNMFNSSELHADKIFEDMTSKIFIEKVKHNFLSKQIIITAFNVQSAVIRQIVFFKINEKRIKNKKTYKNY